MKVDVNPKVADKVEIKIQKQQQKEKFKFVGTLHPKPNQRCFEIDLDTMIVKESEYFYKSKTINWFDALKNKKSPKNKSVIVKENHDYIIKLNLENALKHFKKVWKNKNVKI